MARPGLSPGGWLLLTTLAALLAATRVAADSDDLVLAPGPAAEGPSPVASAAPPPALPPLPKLPLSRITLPPGFVIEPYVNVSMPARFLELGRADEDATVVYVSSFGGSAPVTAIVDRRDGARQACTLLPGLQNPNGIAYDSSTGSLYVAELTRITRFDGVDGAALAGCDASLIKSTLVTDKLPVQTNHGNRALTIGPADGKLYVSIGAPFNVAACTLPFCTIHRLDKNGSNFELYSSGIRNAAGFAWEPKTGALLFAGNERDGMGNDLPDDILMAVNGPGVDFQWPYCHWSGDGPPELRTPGPSRALPDPELTLPQFANQTRPADAVLAQRCSELAQQPLQSLGPHVAPLGLLYWPASGSSSSSGNSTGSSGGGSSVSSAGGQQEQWPAQYDGSVFVGEHGSWDRTVPIGYRIANVQLSPDGTTPVGHTVFAEGWLNARGQHWGRPVGLLRLPDGSMLVADDVARAVYRISYVGVSPPPPPPPSAAGPRAGGRLATAAALLASACASLLL